MSLSDIKSLVKHKFLLFFLYGLLISFWNDDQVLCTVVLKWQLNLIQKSSSATIKQMESWSKQVCYVSSYEAFVRRIVYSSSNTLNLNKCVVDGQWENWRSCRLFRHSAPLSTHSENRSRLGWTIIISYRSLCFVNPSLESVRLFKGLHDFHIAFNTPCLP